MQAHGISVKPVRATVPNWVAAPAAAAIRRAARIGDAWLIVPSSSLHEVATQMCIYRAALTQAGPAGGVFSLATRVLYRRQPKIGARCVAGAARIQVRGVPRGLPGSTQMPLADFVGDRFITGDVACVKEAVARYQEMLDVDHVIMRVQWPRLLQERALAAIRRRGACCA